MREKIVRFRRFLLTIELTLNFRKPTALYYAVKSYLRAKLSNYPVLRGVDIVGTFDCNLKCKHCNVSLMGKSDKAELSLDHYKDIEKQCSELGVFQYCFTGGEPLLNKGFVELLQIFKPAKRIIILQTNGTFIDSIEKAKWMKKIGVDIVNLSIDSGIKDEHDLSRGISGHFDQTLRAIKYCRKAGLKVVIGTVVSHSNLYSAGINRLIKFCQKKLIILIFNLAVPSGNWDNNKNILLTYRDQEYVREIIKNNFAVRLDMDSTINQYGCPAWKEKLYITPYGDVAGCTFTQISFGNIKEKRLSQIRDLALKTDLLNKFSDRCYAAENREFIQNYLFKLGTEVPVDYQKFISTHGK